MVLNITVCLLRPGIPSSRVTRYELTRGAVRKFSGNPHEFVSALPSCDPFQRAHARWRAGWRRRLPELTPRSAARPCTFQRRAPTTLDFSTVLTKNSHDRATRERAAPRVQ